MSGHPIPSSTSTLSGHLGHLTAEQEQVLSTLKQSLSEAKLYIPAIEGKKATHDDPTLLRFLRARNWDVLAAQKQFADYKVWLKKHNVLQVLRDLSPADMLRTQRYYPRWTGRRDKLGNPIFVYRVASLKPLQEEIFEVPPETRYERVAALVEYMTLFYLPLCTHLPHSTEPTPISSTTTIVDLEGVSLNLVWKLRSLFQEAFRMNSENYPETMSKVVIINLPWFFSTIWDWVKGWCDEHMRSKIYVLGQDPGTALREFIDLEDLPKNFGGELDWKFEDEPLLDEDAKQVLGELPKGPFTFVDGKVAPISSLFPVKSS